MRHLFVTLLLIFGTTLSADEPVQDSVLMDEDFPDAPLDEDSFAGPITPEVDPHAVPETGFAASAGCCLCRSCVYKGLGFLIVTAGVVTLGVYLAGHNNGKHQANQAGV